MVKKKQKEKKVKYLNSQVLNNKIIQYLKEKKLSKTEKQIEKGIFRLKDLIDLRDELRREFKEVE